MKKKEVINSLQMYMIHLVMLIVFWGGLLRTNYNADTIFHMVVDDADVKANIEAGRYMISLGDYILLQFGLRTTSNISISMLLTFLLFALAMTKAGRIFEQWSPEDLWKKAGYYIGIQLVFLNVLFAELLMFNEYCIYFAFGYCMAVFGVDAFARRKYIPMLLYLSVAVMTYQYTVVFAAVMIAFYVCLENNGKLTPDSVKAELVGIVLPMGLGGLNYLSVIVLIKLGIITDFGKSAGVGDMHEKVNHVISSLKELYQSSAGIFPDFWIPLLFTVAIWGFIITACYRKKELDKLIFIFMVWIGSHLLLYVIPVVQSRFSFPPRMSFCFYLIQGGMVIIAYMVACEDMKRLLTIGCAAYLVVQLLFAQFIVSNRFVSNTLDEVYVNMAYQEVLKYEEETGVEVTGLAVIDDAYAPDHYEEVSYKSGQINERCLGTVTNSLVWAITKRRFEIAPMDEMVYKQYFEGKDWNYLNLQEQLVIIGDTAYWCIF